VPEALGRGNFGTIDPGYRGEIRVVMFNFGHVDYIIELM